MKSILRFILNERAVIGAVLTDIAVQLEANWGTPSFGWREVIFLIGGLILRRFVTPFHKPQVQA